ncbi:hypothetical protein DPMN_005249 [Dreissena polymorpha]|uniref:Uncharacterized protein n=1 Tax=Dreissena polymorpha TaxID=45954 RepID=A0A9D4RU89_DREPO|nr:hypothetical protein DPMN_005249 [Dreissena polymorpha]
MVEPTIWPAWEGREGGSREKIGKTRRTYGRTNHLGLLGRRDKAEIGMREEDKTDLW